MYRAFAINVPSAEATSFVDLINNNPGSAAAAVLKFAETDLNGSGHVGVGTWWADDLRQVQYAYGEGGHLVWRDGKVTFDDWNVYGSLLVRVTLQGTPQGKPIFQNTNFAEGTPIDITDVMVWATGQGYVHLGGGLRTVASTGSMVLIARDDAFLRSLTVTEESDSVDQMRKLVARDPSGALVAFIEVYGRYYAKAKGKVAGIEVGIEFRRRGVATWLFDLAQNRWSDLTVKHSTDLTNDGRAWKRSLSHLAPVRAHLHTADIDPGRLGQCYNLSLKYVRDHPGWILVHGSIGGAGADLNRDNPNPAPRIGHAWAISEQGDQAWEPISGQEFAGSRFRNLFDAIEWVRYTDDEALILSLKTGHWGPWDAEYIKTDEMWRANFAQWQAKQTKVSVRRVVASKRGDRVWRGFVTDPFRWESDTWETPAGQALVQRIHDGTATAQDLLGMVFLDEVGGWWAGAGPHATSGR